ncbi:MAG: ArsC/Spx/MgsR family protein [Polyangiales bacterium]
MAIRPILLSYDGCSTCKRARAFLEARSIAHDLRAIVDQPPTRDELARWIPASGKPIRKWLNTSGLSYRARGKPAFDAAADDEIARWLTEDGKLVKRPVLVVGARVLVGFDEAAWSALLET